MAEEVVQILLRVKSHMIWQIIISYCEAPLEPDDSHSLQSTMHQKIIAFYPILTFCYLIPIVEYYYENNSNGYLVYPELANNTQQQPPAVIMIHEWFGLNEHIKNQANILAKEGYVVLAVDLYQGKIA
jgi:Dienelactone hydrolase family